MGRHDELNATRIPVSSEPEASDPAAESMGSDQDNRGPSLKLQKAHAQKIEAELNLRKFAIEHDIERLEHSHAAKSQQLAFVSKQATLKQDELQGLKAEVRNLDEALSQKRLTVESLKTAIEGERQELTRLRNAVHDLQLDSQKLTDNCRTQQQLMLDYEAQMAKAQQRQSVMLADLRKTEEELQSQQELLKSEKIKLETLLLNLQKTQETYDTRLRESYELDRQITEQRDRLTSIVADCQDKARMILNTARHDASQVRDEAEKAAELLLQESQQRADALASATILGAEDTAHKIVSTARLEAADMLTASHEQSGLLVKEAESRAIKMNAQAQADYEQLLAEAKQEADDRIGRAQSQSEQWTLEARKRAEQLSESAYEEKQRIVEAADQARQKIIEEARDVGEKQIAQAHQYAQDIKVEAEGRIQLLQAEINGLEGFLATEKDTFQQALKVERQQFMQDLYDDRQRFEDQRRQSIEENNNEKERLDQRAQVLIQEHDRLEAKLNERRLEFERELLQQKQKMGEEWDRKNANFARIVEQKSQELAEQAQAMKAKAEQEIKELRGQTERELVQLRMQHEWSHQNWVKVQQENFHKVQNRHRNQILDTITALVQSALRSQVPDLDPAGLSQLATVTRKAAEEAFLDAEKQTQAVSLHSTPLTGSNNHFKDLRYWRSLFLHSSMKWGLLAVALSLGAWLWKNSSDRQTMSAANSYVEDQIKLRKKIPYVPEQSRIFKASYTDNVLYTVNYLEYERHKNTRNRWIVALNRHGIEKLDINSEVIVKLLAKEAALLKQLEKMKSEIDGKDPEPEIASMREVEGKYREQMIVIVGSDEKFKDFLTFKGHYFESILQKDPD